MKRTIFGRMKDSFNRLKKNRILYAFLVTVLAFNMVVVTSFAWLTLNRKTDVDEMGMSLAVDDTSAVYEAYMYDLETGKGTNTYVDKEDGNKVKPFNIANIDLNQYDTIFQGQNKYTPVFARIKIIKSQAMPESGTIKITVEREEKVSEKDKDTPSDALTSFTSSIVRFTSFIIHDKADLEKTTPETLYEFINSTDRFNEVEGYSGQKDHSKTFVEKQGEGEGHTHSKTTSLTIEIPYVATDWYTVEDNGTTLNVLNVYLYITYDPSLVDCYMEDHGGGGISLEDTTIYLDNDMKKVTVSYSATN